MEGFFSRDPYQKTDLESLYFKKAVFKDLPFGKQQKSKANIVIEDEISSLNRTILKGLHKKQIEARIQELVYSNQFQNVKPETKDLCEIADYACRNNIPIRICYLKMLIPTIEIADKDILNEKEYEKWMKNKSQEEELPDSVFRIDDEYGVREEENSKRGRKDFNQWKTQKNNNKWRKM